MSGKKYDQVKALVEEKDYDIDEAIDLLPKLKTAKFNESVEMSFLMGVDPKQADQNIRGMVSLPAGTGKNVRVAVFARGDKAKEAEEAGADYVGSDDLAKKIQDGWFDFDVAIAAPDTMDVVGKLGRVLGPRGLMPNPKLGTVTNDIKKAVVDMKAGKVEYRVDKFANIHVAVGKSDFSKENLMLNITALLDALIKARPSSAKGQYIRKCHLALTMSPSIKINTSKLMKSK
jgi:large subunit ribosomal protein L1